MSQTTGDPGHDPEKDEWLKKFSGIPKSHEPNELTNDRPYFDDIMKQRPGGLTIEGQIASLGDGLAGLKEKRDHDHVRGQQKLSKLRRMLYCGYALIALALVITAVLAI